MCTPWPSKRSSALDPLGSMSCTQTLIHPYPPPVYTYTLYTAKNLHMLKKKPPTDCVYSGGWPCGDLGPLGGVSRSLGDGGSFCGVGGSPCDGGSSCGYDVVSVPAPLATLLPTTESVAITGTAVITERPAVADGDIVMVHDRHVITAATVHRKHAVRILSSGGICCPC